MANSVSSMVSVTVMSPNRDKKRNHKVTRITPHCMVGQLTATECGNIFRRPSYMASSNYGIGSDGKIGLYVDEESRSWCSSSADNDNRAITIECASDAKHPYAMNKKVWEALVALCTDICLRYGKKTLIWFGDKQTTLSYTPKETEMILTAHRWFAAKACPGDWLYMRLGKLADEVNAALLNAAPPAEEKVKESPKKNVFYDTEEDREKYIWNFFSGKGLNDFAVAGLMGNLYSESALRPNNLQNSYEARLGMTDKGYTEAVNNGRYANFVHDGAGYGLAQWTYWSRKEALLKFIRSRSDSIDSMESQCEFLWRELAGYDSVMAKLKNADSVRTASDAVLTGYEKPADQSSTVKRRRAAFGQGYYDKYSSAKKDIVKTSIGYYVQFGAFSSQASAAKKAEYVEASGFTANVEKIDGLFRVFAGYYDAAEANKLAAAAREEKLSVIVKERKVSA